MYKDKIVSNFQVQNSASFLKLVSDQIDERIRNSISDGRFMIIEVENLGISSS